MSKLPKAEQVIEAIRANSGNLAAVGRQFGVTRQSVDEWVKRHPTALAACQEARETMLDNAESRLYKNVLDGDTTALIFFLKTQGKRRGYVERQEVTGADGGSVNIIIERYEDKASPDPA